MKTRILILVLTVLALGACAKKSTKSGASRGSRLTNGQTANPQAGSQTCQAGVYGAIYDDYIDGYAFTQRLIDFTGNPDIGYVESRFNQRHQTGVNMRMSVVFTNNQFNAAQSQILIQIIDDKAAQGLGRLEDITLKGQSAVNRGNGQFSATFSDQYGVVIVEGVRDSSSNMINGVIHFQNQGAQAQQLGRIYISACSLSGI